MTRARAARIADGVTLALCAVAFLTDLNGSGAIAWRRWSHLSLQSPITWLFAALAVVIVRHLWIRHPSFRERQIERRVAAGRATTTLARLDGPSAREWLLAAGVMVVATAWVLSDQLRNMTAVPDRGDPLYVMWRLAWTAHALATDPWHLLDANIFFPATTTLAYTDIALLPSLLGAPFLWAGAPVAVVYHSLIILSFVAGGLTMFLLARAVIGASGPALFCGVLFGCYPYRISTYSHLEMQGVWLMPLAVYFLLRACDTGRARDAVGLGLAASAQLLWSLYLGAYLAVVLCVLTVALWTFGWIALRARIRTLLLAAFVAAAVSVPYSVPYWRAHATVGERAMSEVTHFSATPADYLTVNDMNRLYGSRLRRDIIAERHLFPGASALVFSVVALVPPAAPLTAALAASTAVAADASLGTNGLMFPALFRAVPPFRAYRVPARFGMVVGLGLTLLAGLGLTRLARRSGRAYPLVVAAATAFAMFELRPALELTALPTSAPAIYAALPHDGSPIVDLPLPLDDGQFWIEPSYMYYSTFHWHPLLNGYSGFTPAWYPRLMIASRELPGDDAIRVLREAGARYLVLHEEFATDGRYATLARGLDARPDLTLVAVRRLPEGESRAYQLR